MQKFLDELLSDDERNERDEEQFFSKFDRQIAAGEVTQH